MKTAPTLAQECDQARVLELHSEYPSTILPGYYSNGHTWISVDLDADLPEDLVLSLCNMSYKLVFETLPNKTKQEISEMNT